MKRFLPLILIVCLPVFLNAQQDDSFRLGVKAGPDFSFSTGDVDLGDYASPAFTFGGIGGGFAEFVPIENFSVEFDLLYSYTRYGVKISTGEKVTIEYSAIEMPLILKGRIPSGDGSFFLGAGADFLLIPGKVKLREGNTTVTLPPDQVFHTSLAISGGYDWLLESGTNLTLELRYHHSFTSPLDEADIHANRFDILVGWSVNL